MFQGAIDVLIPTEGKRINGLLYQIYAFLNQSYNMITIWVLIDSSQSYQIEKHIIESMGVVHGSVNLIHVPKEWSGNHGHNAIRYALGALPLRGTWFNTSGDDDCVMEWGMERLVANSDDVDMVIGKCIPTRRNHDYQEGVLGRNLGLGMITGSCCLYRTSKVKELGYPTDEYNADWILIEKMLEGNFRKIDSVIYVMPQSLEEEAV